MTIEITETHITEIDGPCTAYGGIEVKRNAEGTFWSIDNDEATIWHPIPHYLYDAIMRHHREVGS